MSKYVFYLKLKPFLAQYMIHHFGNPINLNDTNGNDRIIAVLQKRKPDTPPEVAGEGLTPVCIPYSKGKDPAGFNFIGKAGKAFIVDWMESIFMNNLIDEMKIMYAKGMKLQIVAEAWCEKHGINIDYADTIRMRYYRHKLELMKKEINTFSKKRNRKD